MIETLPQKAQAFARTRHAGQAGKRPGEPYMQHVEAVVELLLDQQEPSASVLAAAYLHDCLEKTDTTVLELIREFGEDVAELVYWLTDPDESEDDVKHLLSAWRLARAPREAKIIKLADIADNADAILAHDPQRWPGFRAEKSAILDGMLRIEGSAFDAVPLFVRARAALQRAPA